MKTTTINGANGQITFDLGWRGAFKKLTFVGGPYDAFPGRAHAFGVCVRQENVRKGSFDINVPIEDFSVPPMSMRPVVEDALYRAAKAAVDGQLVYVGCMGGWGRTGLFLSLLAKACGEGDPVAAVRQRYTVRAVETKQQKNYVDEFDVSDARVAIYRAAWLSRFPWLRKFV